MDNLIVIDNVRGYMDETDTAWLNAEDVARGFGFVQEKGEIEYVRWDRVNDYLRGFGFSPLVGKDSFIPENMVYRLGFKASNETAQAFQAKLADEIIPSIRKRGIYATDDVIERILNNPDYGIRLLTTLKEERIARKEAERQAEIERKEKEEAQSTVAVLMHERNTYTMTKIAKELGLKSAKALNAILARNHIQYYINGTWVFYSEYSGRGYEQIKQDILDNGKVIYHRRITQLGREFILKLFNNGKVGR